jgi:hypothetical protein
MMNWKGLEGSGHGLFLGIIPLFAGRIEEQLSSVVSVPAEFRTWHLQNTIQKIFSLRQLAPKPTIICTHNILLNMRFVVLL